MNYDLVVYNIDTGELRIRAGLVSERKFYCKLFSLQLFQDPTFFEHGETFDLDAIYRLEDDIQSTGFVPGIERIVLLEILGCCNHDDLGRMLHLFRGETSQSSKSTAIEQAYFEDSSLAISVWKG